MRLFTPLRLALLFAAAHLLFVVVPLVVTQGSGEGQAISVVLFDAPLVSVLQKMHGGPDLLYATGGVHAYIWFFSVAGTSMYAAVGLVLGLLVRLVRRRRDSDSEN